MQTFRTPQSTLLDIKVEELIIAGWAARDQAAVDQALAELLEPTYAQKALQ